MLDIRLIKENPEFFKERLNTRNGDYSDKIDTLLVLDKERRALITETETKKAEQNAISKKIPELKKKGEDVSEIFKQMKSLSEDVKTATEKINEIDANIEGILLSIPNIPDESVPVGADDSENVVVYTYGEPKKFDFEPLPHWEIGAKLGILDPNSAAKITGARFHVYKGLGARLERAVINFFLDTHTSGGYTEIFPPFMVNRASMRGTGQLPKFEDDAFKVAGTDYFLIPTAEVPVTNLHRGDILSGSDLPIRYCAYTACFRSEAGSAGRDTRGLIRQHQFNKVELVTFSKPEESYAILESLTRDAASLLEKLGIAYRISALSTGDMGFSSAKTYDIEVWMPSYNRYVEISSCSNFTDYQARRADIKYKENAADKAKFVHTLNGSGLAVGRTVAAILENCQKADASVEIPDVLVPYMGIKEIKVQ